MIELLFDLIELLINAIFDKKAFCIIVIIAFIACLIVWMLGGFS